MFANLGEYFKCLDLNYEYYKKKGFGLVHFIHVHSFLGK